MDGKISHVQEASCPMSEKETAKTPTPPGHPGNAQALPEEDQKRTHDKSDERDATIDQASNKPERRCSDKREALLAKKKRRIKRRSRDHGVFASQVAIEYQKQLNEAKRQMCDDEKANHKIYVESIRNVQEESNAEVAALEAVKD